MRFSGNSLADEKAHEGQQVPDFGNAEGLELEETRRVISNIIQTLSDLHDADKSLG
jgi:hypothetical protein